MCYNNSQEGKVNCQFLFVHMHEPTFRQALSHSWSLVKHKKSLWIFGLLSAVIGQWGLSDFFGALYNTARNNYYAFDWAGMALYFNIWNWHKVSVVLLVLWLFGLILLLALSLIFVAVSARGAIISYAIQYYKTGKILSLHDAWNKGVKKFFPLLVVTAVSRVLQLLDLGLFGMVARQILRHNSTGWSLLFVLIALLSVFIALIIEATSIYASGYLLLENKNIQKSLQKGWELFSDHLLVSLELAVVLVLFNVLFLGAVIYGSFAAFIPSLIMWMVSGFTGLGFLVSFGLYTGMTLYAALVMVLAGIFNAFVTCAWVYLFMKMHHEGVLSRTAIFFKKLFRLE